MKRTQWYYLILFILPAMVIFSMLQGCGYHFRATGEPIGMRFRSLAIPMIESTSARLGFESDFTTVLREEFITHSKIPIFSEDRADVIIQCRIYEINEDPISYTLTRYNSGGYEITHEETRSKRMIIKMDVKLRERESGKIIWQDKAMKDRAIFLVDQDPLITRYNRKRAVMEIAERMAKRIYLRTMERF
jgi:outer membrane lipopolysaccharide assembly protein LptE/RlpB